jgi:hypothetical protein
MGIQADVKDALASGRSDLVRVLAEYRVVPTVVERSDGGSNLLGGSASPTFGLESRGEAARTTDRQTTVQVVDMLGLESEEDCERVREEIENHSAWGSD